MGTELVDRVAPNDKILFRTSEGKAVTESEVNRAVQYVTEVPPMGVRPLQRSSGQGWRS